MGSRFPWNFTSRVRVRAQDGFTLVEVLVSALIIVLIAAGVAQALIASTHFSGSQREHSQADQVAQQDQERMKGMSDQQLDALDQTRNVTFNNGTFNVHSTATFLNASGTSSCSNGVAAYYKLTSTVTWPDGTRTGTVTEEAIITRAVTGAILQQVVDQTGTGLPGASVSVAGQNTSYGTSGTTDSDGCVLLTGLPTDSYGITVNDPGYVDADGDTTPNGASVAVNQTTVANPTKITVGLAGSTTTTFQTVTATQHNGTYVLPVNGNVLSYYGNYGGSHMTAAKTTGSTSSTASSWPASNLFPFYSAVNQNYTNNYQLWAGKCEQEQPLQPPTNGGVATGVATVTPGGAVTGVVDQPALDLAVRYNGADVTPSHVKIIFQSTSGTACSETWTNVSSAGTDTISGVNYNIYPAPFASNSAQGASTASATGDQGQIKLCVDYRPNSATPYKSETWTTTNSNFAAPTVSARVMDLKSDTSSGTTYVVGASGTTC